MKIGAYAGKFLPPHIGHAQSIAFAAEQCDKLYVVLAEDPARCKELCKKAGLPNLTAQMRISWLKKHFSGAKNIEFLYMDESGIPPFPSGMAEWAKRFWRVVPTTVNAKFADETYRQLNQLHFPGCEFIAFDRTIIPISATQIRQDLKANFNYLLPCSKPYFKKHIQKEKPL